MVGRAARRRVVPASRVGRPAGRMHRGAVADVGRRLLGGPAFRRRGKCRGAIARGVRLGRRLAVLAFGRSVLCCFGPKPIGAGTGGRVLSVLARVVVFIRANEPDTEQSAADGLQRGVEGIEAVRAEVVAVDGRVGLDAEGAVVDAERLEIIEPLPADGGVLRAQLGQHPVPHIAVGRAHARTKNKVLCVAPWVVLQAPTIMRVCAERRSD